MDLVQQNNPRRLLVPNWLLPHGFLGRELDFRAVTHSAPDSQTPVESELFQGQPLYLLQQVHGADLIEVLSESDLQGLESDLPHADGWLIAPEVHVGRFGIRTADCIPVLLRGGGYRAALHCGWRSTLSGILSTTLTRLHALGVAEVEVAIGPGAQRCCYEIQEDVAGLVRATVRDLPDNLRNPVTAEELMVLHSTANGKYFLDLARLLVEQALRYGVRSEGLFQTKLCTICTPDFFSYRREKELSGRQVSFI